MNNKLVVRDELISPEDRLAIVSGTSDNMDAKIVRRFVVGGEVLSIDSCKNIFFTGRLIVEKKDSGRNTAFLQ